MQRSYTRGSFFLRELAYHGHELRPVFSMPGLSVQLVSLGILHVTDLGVTAYLVGNVFFVGGIGQHWICPHHEGWKVCIALAEIASLLKGQPHQAPVAQPYIEYDQAWWEATQSQGPRHLSRTLTWF